MQTHSKRPATQNTAKRDSSNQKANQLTVFEEFEKFAESQMLREYEKQIDRKWIQRMLKEEGCQCIISEMVQRLHQYVQAKLANKKKANMDINVDLLIKNFSNRAQEYIEKNEHLTKSLQRQIEPLSGIKEIMEKIQKIVDEDNKTKDIYVELCSGKEQFEQYEKQKSNLTTILQELHNKPIPEEAEIIKIYDDIWQKYYAVENVILEEKFQTHLEVEKIKHYCENKIQWYKQRAADEIQVLEKRLYELEQQTLFSQEQMSMMLEDF